MKIRPRPDNFLRLHYPNIAVERKSGVRRYEQNGITVDYVRVKDRKKYKQRADYVLWDYEWIYHTPQAKDALLLLFEGLYISPTFKQEPPPDSDPIGRRLCGVETTIKRINAND